MSGLVFLAFLLHVALLLCVSLHFVRQNVGRVILSFSGCDAWKTAKTLFAVQHVSNVDSAHCSTTSSEVASYCLFWDNPDVFLSAKACWCPVGDDLLRMNPGIPKGQLLRTSKKMSPTKVRGPAWKAMA